MITVYAYKKEPNKDENYYEYLGLSTDTKSQDKKVAVNSLFFELDTGDFYYLETPAQSGKEDLIPEMSFTGSLIEEEDFYGYEIEGTAFFNEKITVIFDGQKYDMTVNIIEEGGKYGLYGEFDDDHNPSFGIYPFAIEGYEENESKSTFIAVQDDNEHTIEVYVDSSTPAVWKKVGSGASGGDAVVGTAIVGTSKVGKGEEPQEEGYEITNPVLTLNISGDVIDIPQAWYVDENGYLTNGPIFSANGETKLVAINDDGDYYAVIYKPDSYSNAVNCTVEDEDEYMYIIITDPTQDASIDVDYTVG